MSSRSFTPYCALQDTFDLLFEVVSLEAFHARRSFGYFCACTGSEGGRKRAFLDAGPSELASHAESGLIERRREEQRGREAKSVWVLERDKERGRTKQSDVCKADSDRIGGIEKQRTQDRHER